MEEAEFVPDYTESTDEEKLPSLEPISPPNVSEGEADAAGTTRLSLLLQAPRQSDLSCGSHIPG